MSPSHENLRLGARRRRRARAGAYRRDRGARRHGHQTHGDCRHLDRLADRRVLCGGHERQGYPPPRHRFRPRLRRHEAPPDDDARRQFRRPALRALEPGDADGCREILRAIPARAQVPDGFLRARNSAHRDDDRPAPAAGRHRSTSGPLRPALAASIAIPGLFRPVVIDGRVLVDGGTTNPHAVRQAHRTAPIASSPSTFTASPRPSASTSRAHGKRVYAAALVMGGAIVAAKLNHAAPDLVIRPNVSDFPHPRLPAGKRHHPRRRSGEGRSEGRLGALLK